MSDPEPAGLQIESSPREMRARVAIDLGAQSCRVSLLQWRNGLPSIRLVHRVANGPVHASGSLRWPFEAIYAGLEEGLKIAAEQAPEGIASIAVDGWAVDYVRLDAQGVPLAEPHCYRDERTVAAKLKADNLVDAESMFRRTGAQPLRINTVYQLLADQAEGIDAHAPWVNLPEYVLYRLGGRRVAEYTNATHTGLVDVKTGNWSRELQDCLSLPAESFPLLVPTGSVLGNLAGPLADLQAFSNTQLIAPACHDTASAVAGIPVLLANVAYISSGTWSLVGTCVDAAITTPEVAASRFTNQGAAGGGFCFHANVNGMWLLQQCMESWERAGRPWQIAELVAQSDRRSDTPGTVDVDAQELLLDGDMPALLNEQLRQRGNRKIDDQPGNEPLFARMIFESLARRYAEVVRDLERILDIRVERVHVLGGGSRNYVLTRLTEKYAGVPVETGNVEGATIGNFALQLAAADERAGQLEKASIRAWAKRLSIATGGLAE
jgi:rhamnulokinase